MAKRSTQIQIGRKSFDGPVDVGRTVQVTRFANELSARTYNPKAEPRNGRIVLLPGEIKDVDAHPYTIFGTHRGTLSYEMPIASVASVYDKQSGLMLPSLKFYDHWGQAIQELRDDIVKYGSKEATAKARRVGLANIVNSTVIDSTKNLNILDRVLGLQSRSYFLQNIATPIPAPNLVFTADTFTEGSVQAKVPELESPMLVSHSESRTTKVLYKNVAHIAESEEAEFMQMHNTAALRQDWAIRDLARLLNAQLATVAETAGATGGADWGANSGGYSTNRPFDDLQPRITSIRGYGFNVDYVAAHDRPAMDLTSNTWVKGTAPGPGAELGVDAFRLQGFSGIGIIDQALTATIALVGSKDAIWLGQGPVVVASYDEQVIGYRGWLVKQYLLPYLAQTNGINKLTGISA